MDPWVCYLIMAEESAQTYVGASNDAVRRLATHNSGKGAKRTRGQSWSHVLIINGFDCKQSCLSFEAGWKRLGKRRSNLRLREIDPDLKYTADTVWNRLLDLLYFMHNFTCMGTKFILNKNLAHDTYWPEELVIRLSKLEYLFDLPWPEFVSIELDE